MSDYFNLSDESPTTRETVKDGMVYNCITNGDYTYASVQCQESEEENLIDIAIKKHILLKGKEIPVTVISLGGFRGCVNLKSIHVPEGIEKIYAGAFADCEALIEIFLPDSLKWLGFGAFSGCKSLRKVSLPGICEINGDPFTGCDLKRLIIERRT